MCMPRVHAPSRRLGRVLTITRRGGDVSAACPPSFVKSAMCRLHARCRGIGDVWDAHSHSQRCAGRVLTLPCDVGNVRPACSLAQLAMWRARTHATPRCQLCVHSVPTFTRDVGDACAAFPCSLTKVTMCEPRAHGHSQSRPCAGRVSAITREVGDVRVTLTSKSRRCAGRVATPTREVGSVPAHTRAIGDVTAACPCLHAKAVMRGPCAHDHSQRWQCVGRVPTLIRAHLPALSNFCTVYEF